jgi:hypothetical protein
LLNWDGICPTRLLRDMLSPCSETSLPIDSGTWHFYSTPKLTRAIQFRWSSGSWALLLHQLPMEYQLKIARKLVEYLHGRGKR